MMNATQPHILVVDDDEVSRKLLKRIFQRVCTVDMAENGRQALEKMVAYEYDVVLLDIMMRDLSGLDVLKILRHSKSMLELPVILISAMSDTEDVARGIRLGANDYITKPYELDVVQARVNTQLHLKSALNDRQRLIAQLESANKMKSQLLEIASHDIKGPLNNLRMLGTVMQNQASEHPALEKFTSIMETNIQAMLRVADSVMEVRTVDKANTPLEHRPLHVPDAIRQVVFQHKTTIQNKRLQVLLEDSDRWVLGDAERFQQALSNVIHNAVRYSPSQSTVTIQVQAKDKVCRIRVVDEGVGIAEEDRKHLFTPFSASRIGQQPLNRTEQGKGMGLWIAKELMSSQGGTIGFEPVATGGSIFWLELPLASTPQLTTETNAVLPSEERTQTAATATVTDATETVLIPVALDKEADSADDDLPDTEPMFQVDEFSPTIAKPPMRQTRWPGSQNANTC